MKITYLHRQLCRLSTLRAGWLRVVESDGCAGIDSVTISVFGHKLESELLRLSEELTKGQYVPLPLLRFFVVKINGGQRPLAVPAVRDRVVQDAALILIGPTFDREFETCSFAYRKGHSVKQALQQVERLREAGYQWVLDADITSYFENVDHDLLFARVAELVPDQKLMDLIRLWVTARVYDGHQLTVTTKGLPQGSPLSPILANLYLDTFDEQMLGAGQKLVRFADDFLVLCKTKPRAEEALKLTREVLDGLRLSLNDEKTRITNFTDGFKYLGASFAAGFCFVPPRRSHLASNHAEITMPPPLPILRAAPRRHDPFNPALHDALMKAFADIAPKEIPSFFTRPRSTAAGDQPTEDFANQNSTEPDSVESNSSSTAPPPSASRSSLPPPSVSLLRTLYIHEHGAIIRCEDEHLRIVKEEVELLSLPAFKVDQIILFGNSQITTSAMKFCLRNNIPIIVLNGFGRFFGAIESTGNQNVLLHQKQFERLSDQSFVFNTARQIVRGKIMNCRSLLQRRQRSKSDDRLAQSINELLSFATALNKADTLDQLRGHEGAAAASYFAALAICLPAAFEFSKRSRQPPVDPVNALLSFGYTLLFYNIYAIVRARGLSPYVGSLHALRQGHPALCSDLIEELRAPIIDSLVTGLLNRMVFTPADFYFAESPGAFDSNEDNPGRDLSGSPPASSADTRMLSPDSPLPGGCFLTDPARKRFVAHFERRMNTFVRHPVAKMRTTWRGCIDLQVTSFIRALRGESERYLPLEIR